MLRAIWDSIQKQNENIALLREEMLRVSMQNDEENRHRTAEIKNLGKTVAALRTGFESPTTDDFASIITEDNESASTAINRSGNMAKARKLSGLAAPDIPPVHLDIEQSEVEERGYFPPAPPTLRAKDAIHYIPTLNGDDDVGVEDFIKEVRSMKGRCMEQDLLLKAIKVEKIVGKAAQSIRNIPIECYSDLYDALRNNLAAQVTSDEYQEQLRELRQGSEESVQCFNIRFRRILNRLLYAVTNEYPQPLTRKIMTEEITKKTVRVYLMGLRRDIGRILLSSEPLNLAEAEKKAADVERYLREERQPNWSCNRLPFASNRPNNQLMQVRRSNVPSRSPNTPVAEKPATFNQIENRPPAERAQIKCFKCGKLGHIANKCQNFLPPSQRDRPPARIQAVQKRDEIQETTSNQEMDEPYETYESTSPQEDYSQYFCQPEPKSEYFWSTQEQG
ncbi:uncharacterized protein [Bombus flavifrons]|uniref:uncharacterized protein n=1 Tax=Bombus flavifrons TaxID=103934 RepID=UPI0037037721